MLEVAAQIGHSRQQCPPNRFVDCVWPKGAAAGQEATHHVGEVCSPLICRKLRVVDADEREVLWQQTSCRKIIDRRDDKSFGQVASRAKDDHRTRGGGSSLGGGVVRRHGGSHNASLRLLCFASCSRAAITTWSGVKPNFVSNPLRGAEAPNVCMPTTAPRRPT